MLFCTLDWLELKGLNIEVGEGLTSEVGLTLTIGDRADVVLG